MHFDEFAYIFHQALVASGICLNAIEGKPPGIFSLRMTSEEEDDYYGDYRCAYDEDRYVLHIRAAKTAVIDGVQLPLPLALKATAAAIQREVNLVIIDVTEAEGGADIVFKPIGYYGIEPGAIDVD